MKKYSKKALFEIVLALVFFFGYLYSRDFELGVGAMFLFTWAQLDQLEHDIKR